MNMEQNINQRTENWPFCGLSQSRHQRLNSPLTTGCVEDSLEEYDTGFVLGVHSPVVRMRGARLGAEHHPAQDGETLSRWLEPSKRESGIIMNDSRWL